MVKVSSIYSSPYLAAGDLGSVGPRRSAIIRNVRQEVIGIDREVKLTLTLANTAGQQWPKRIVLNKGNAQRLQAAFGDATDAWLGKEVEIWAEETSFQGKTVAGIRLAPTVQPAQLAAGNGQSKPVFSEPADDLNDEIPF
jgi:hypothetical protein